MQKSFFPQTLGPLAIDQLVAADKATSVLAPYARELLFVKGIRWPDQPTAEPHAESLAMVLTATPPTTHGSSAAGGGPSADWVIANKVQPGTPPLTLYAGSKGAYIADRLSFSEAGKVTPGVANPFEIYQRLIGVAGPAGSTTPETDKAKQLLVESRLSVHDLVRDELKSLMGNARLSSMDKQRLQQHFDAIRDIETTLGTMGDTMVERCSWDGVEVSKLRALETFQFKNDGMIEDIVRLHMSLVALAFGCNFTRTATLQWGTGEDATKYAVSSNTGLGWTFNQISHRSSGSGAGNDPTAEQAHAEIDVLRMQTFAAGLSHFRARGLADNSFVLWTNNLSDGPSTSFNNVPHIIWGSGGGYLKQGEYVDAGGTTNNRLLNTLISAAIQDTGETMETFGTGDPGQLDVMLA